MSRSTVVFATVILAAALLGLALSAPASADLPYAVPTPLATGPGTQGAPDLSGNGYPPTHAWEDDARGQWDVLALLEIGVTVQPLLDGAQRNPTTYDHILVYEDDRNGNWDLFAYDTYPGSDTVPPPVVRETQLTTDAADQLDPDIFKSTVVYEDWSAGNADIAVVDVTTGIGRRLTTNAADQVDPSIRGTKVVFADRRNGNWDIYCYDLARNTLKRLTTSKAAQTRPQIGRNGLVVYQDRRNGDWDIYSYSLSTGTERRLTTHEADQTAPEIDEYRPVVYEDDRRGQSDLYLYDLETRRNCRLTDGPATEARPSVAGASVAWQDTGLDGGDVYAACVAFPKLELRDPYSVPAYDSTVRISGTLWVPFETGASLPVRVTVNGRSRTVTTGDGDSGGYLAFSVPHVRRKLVIDASFRGDARHLPDDAERIVVKPRALLTRPQLAKIQPDPDLLYTPILGYTASGVLKPHHASGSRAVKVEWWVYEYTSGWGFVWKLKKTISARVFDYGSYSKYKVEVPYLLTSPGKWKVRAVHADGDHARTVSSFSVSMD